MLRHVTLAAGCLLLMGTAIGVPTAARAGSLPAARHCALPAIGRPFATATPAEEDLDAAQVSRAVNQLSARLRLSVQVFRNNCLVAGDPLNVLTSTVHNNVWSITKSVTSILTGIAISQGKVSLDAPIGRYLPHGAGWGDAEHRAITVRELITQTSGIAQAILSEAATTGTDPSLAREALAQPIRHRPGSHFEYSQLGPALLAFVVQQAVGENLRSYAQRVLFSPIGITPGSYLWLEDRSGTPYG